MTKKVGIEGMNCGHCASWVEETLKKVDGVMDAQVSLEAKNALVDLDEAKVTDEMLRDAVVRAGYTVSNVS
ncbi:MAG: heavy-metal-associated domain-containing protein [Nitrospinae bacterium]|nr:heavy-metal-associated domain-containing protein [Nitrospinota bacterium]